MNIIILKNSQKYYDYAIPYLYKNIYTKFGFNSLQDVIKLYNKLKINTFICLNKNTQEYIGSYLLHENNNMIILCDLFIVPKYRKQGIGSRLIEDAKNRSAKLFKYFKLYLYSYKKNINFYKKNGFKIESYNKQNLIYLLSCDLYKINSNIIIIIYVIIIVLIILYFLFR